MKRWTWGLLAVVALGAGCTEPPKQVAAPRAQVRALSGSTMEVVPADGQLPYCLLYTLSEKGVIRQLTMTRENRSIKCESGKPIANTHFRIPATEGKVRAYVIFSDERIQAGPVGQQLYEMRHLERVSALDMRLPGRVFVETLEFTPTADEAPVTGAQVDSTGATEAAAPVDSGAPTAVTPAP
ncbi:hypothetical protein P2318_25980 [Myxococcaceae bacterium GXIMD 01537]